MIEMRGASGELRVSYQIAARFESWSLTGTQIEIGPIAVRVRGHIVDRNDFWLRSGDVLDLWLNVGGQAWCWPVDTFSVVEGSTLIIGAKGNPSVCGRMF